MKVLLYYPTEWRRCLGNLVGGSNFNWFLCSKKFRVCDHCFIELPKKTKFYEVSTGKSWETKKMTTLLVGDFSKRSLEKARRLGYQGVAWKTDKSDTNFIISKEVEFLFFEGLTPSDGCKLVDYAKRYSKEIGYTLPSFPTVKEIDEMLINKSCEEVCLILYPEIENYFSQ